MKHVSHCCFVSVVLFGLFGDTSNRVSATTHCPANAATSPPSTDLLPLREDYSSILSPLLSSAKLTREYILSGPLPYDSIRGEINRSYNRTLLRVAPFIALWIVYAQNSLYLAGFIVFVGVVLPLVMVALWIFWGCCYEVDEEDEEECKYESRSAQLIAWALASVILLSLLTLVAFVAILLTGNSLISSGVSKGGGAVSMVIPEVGRIRDGAVGDVERTLIGGYSALFETVNRNWRSIILQIQLSVEEELGSELQSFYVNVTRQLSSREAIFNKSELLLNQSLALLSCVNNTEDMDSNVLVPDVTSHLENFKSSLSSLQGLCSELLSLNISTTADLNAECRDLLSPQQEGGGVYLPMISADIEDLGGKVSFNQTRLQRMVEIFKEQEIMKDPVIDLSTEYFEEMSQNLTRLVNSTTDVYFGKNSSFYSNLTSIFDEILALNSSLSLDVPTSQEDLNIFLGTRYLAGWNNFRSVCTTAFALIILGVGVWLVIAIGRGLFNIYDLYFHGDYPSNLGGIHQSGRTLKKVSFMLTGVCAVSAAFYGVSLVIAGGLGQGCLPDENFSELLSMVVDDKETWGGTYPLGKALLNNGSFPLTFKDVLENCRLNHSLYTSLQLSNRFNFEEDINVSPAVMMKYTSEVLNLPEVVRPISLLSPYVQAQLEDLRDVEDLKVEWRDFTSLTISSGLFESTFVGVEGVREKLHAMQLALNSASTQLTPTLHSNLTSGIESASLSLSELTAYLSTSLLPAMREEASYLQERLEGNSSSLLLEERTRLLDSLRLELNKASHLNLSVGAFITKDNISTFTSHAINSLQCDTGSCHTIPRLYDQFSSAVCYDVVLGLDLYWSSLLGVLILALCIMCLSLFLASRFIDLKQEKSNKPRQFHVVDSLLRQVRGISWFLLSFCVNLWLLITISTDEEYSSTFCSGGDGGGGDGGGVTTGCCPSCVWIFGVVFLFLTLVVGGLSHLYQCVILHRLSKTVKRVRRYWMDRKKAAQFHGQLAILLLQDLPFLIIAGIYSSRINLLTIPSFFSLAISILSITSYLTYIIRERANIVNYCLCLKKQLKRNSKFNVQALGTTGATDGGGGSSGGGAATAAAAVQAIGMNGRAPNGRYIGSGSEQSESDSQETTQHVDDWMYNPNNANGVGDHRLSVIPEYMEGGELAPPLPPPPQSPLRGGGAGGVMMGGRGGDMAVPAYTDSDSEIQPVTSLGLDRTDSPTESALQRRRVMADYTGVGIEVASIGQYDTTSSTSYFGSKTSMTGSDIQGYYSSSQPPDEHYESSDYREDYDSDYSHTYAQRAKLKLRLHDLPCEMSVDV